MDSLNKPNIVLLLLDGTRLDILNEHRVFQELKERSVVFTNMITPAPYTLPSMASIFTGIYPRKHGNNAYFKKYEIKHRPPFLNTLWISERY